MASPKLSNLQPYPRREGGGYLASDSLFQAAHPLPTNKLDAAIQKAFDRSLTDKRGNRVKLPSIPEELVEKSMDHLRERSDPILSPSFLSQCKAEEVFTLDATAHEMQRHRMRIGMFYQYLVIELMKHRYPAHDGYKEGDVDVDVDTPGFEKGLHLYISVKKSSDTVGGQDVGGMIRRIEEMARADKNRTRPYLGVVCYATPQRGFILPYDQSRAVRCKQDGSPYSPNCEVWSPGFVFPYISGLDPNAIYKRALQQVGRHFPFQTLAHRSECAKLLATRLRKLNLVDPTTDRVDPVRFQEFVSKTR